LIIFRTRAKQSDRIVSEFGLETSDKEISDVLYRKEQRLGDRGAVPAYVSTFNNVGGRKQADAWTYTNVQGELEKSYLAEIERLTKTVKAITEQQQRLVATTIQLRDSMRHTKNAYACVEEATAAIGDFVAYGLTGSVVVDKPGVGEIVADAAYVGTETKSDDLPIGQRLPKRRTVPTGLKKDELPIDQHLPRRLTKLEAKARNAKYLQQRSLINAKKHSTQCTFDEGGGGRL